MTIEELQEQIVTMQEQLTEVKTTNEQLTKDKESQQTKIDELSQINQKLFLRVTSPSTVKEEEEDKDKEYKEYVGDKMWDKLSSVDQTKLKTILEGEDE